MIVEHTFISSRPVEQLLPEAADYLAARGFHRAYDNTTPDTLEMERGAAKAARAKNILQLPTRVRLEYDRGRVAAAASIEPSPVWGGASVTSSAGRPKKMVVHERLLNEILVGLENLLAYNGSGTPDYVAWDEVEARAEHMAELRRKQHRNLLLIVLALVIVLPVIFVVLINFTGR